MFKMFLLLGSLNAFLSIALGAFGAHALKPILGDRLSVYHTGVQYQMMHALALILVAFLAEKWPNSSLIGWAGWLMLVGIILFSGSLYGLSITKLSVFGPITPLGGLAFLAGWVMLMIAAWRA